MEWLNYHHLLYFWVVAREGSLGAASRVLRLAKPTLSGQIKALEERLGEPLFLRSGRKLVLSEAGRVAFRYADEIFSLGREMVESLEGRGPSAKLVVGVADVVPKLVVHRLLRPALDLPGPVRVVCHEDDYERLLARLALHELDVVLADAPVPPGSAVRAYGHLLGECGVTFFGTKRYAGLRRGFPRSLEGAPVLLPAEGTPLRRELDLWLAAIEVRPRVVAEFDDSALLKVFGGEGRGVFAAPSAVEEQVAKQYGVAKVGRVESVRERFYAISTERRLRHPAAVAIREAAQTEVFASPGRLRR